MKLIAVFAFVTFATLCKANNIKSLKDLEAELEDYIDRKVNDQKEKRAGSGLCFYSDVHCHQCAQCGSPGHAPFKGHCMTWDYHSGRFKDKFGKKCICNYGYTGDNAEYLPDVPGEFGTNRIMANSCHKTCHYTKTERNSGCAPSGTCNRDCSTDHLDCDPVTGNCVCGNLCAKKGWNCVNNKCVNPCDECHARGLSCENGECKCNPSSCNQSGGTCADDGNGKSRCKCCRGFAGPHKEYSSYHDTYFADHCGQKCPYKGPGIRNDNCYDLTCYK